MWADPSSFRSSFASPQLKSVFRDETIRSESAQRLSGVVLSCQDPMSIWGRMKVGIEKHVPVCGS